MSLEVWDEVVAVDQRGVYLSCLAAGRRMALRGAGSIVTIASVAGLRSMPLHAYAPAKAAVISITQNLAVEWGRSGVRVNAVAPAGVMTPLMEEWADSQYDAAAALKMVDSWHPLGRMATIEEIGEVCAFLASDEASFITGQVICPDGGAALGYRR
jgi:NAD(P)-dependent dehydrogenase (short-subunit alcohol dehydrogenase family)